MKITVLANDSYFAFLLARPLFERYSDSISEVIISTQNTGSLKRIINIYKRSNREYFFYRVVVQLLSAYRQHMWGESVRGLARTHSIPVRECDDVKKLPPSEVYELGVALNFDQVLRESFLKRFENGIVNVHASKLPRDRGISPALWAFARGDTEYWYTVYRMDEGLDTGPIYLQKSLPAEEHETAFAVYRRICSSAGFSLGGLVGEHQAGTHRSPIEQPRDQPGNIWSWPDEEFSSWLRKSKRTLISRWDVIEMLKKSRGQHVHE